MTKVFPTIGRQRQIRYSYGDVSICRLDHPHSHPAPPGKTADTNKERPGIDLGKRIKDLQDLKSKFKHPFYAYIG
jgi:hypothetical protein